MASTQLTVLAVCGSSAPLNRGGDSARHRRRLGSGPQISTALLGLREGSSLSATPCVINKSSVQDSHKASFNLIPSINAAGARTKNRNDVVCSMIWQCSTTRPGTTMSSR